MKQKTEKKLYKLSIKKFTGEIERVDFTVDNNNIDWIDITDECVASTKKQIEMEVQASIVYLSYASYFSKDTVNRPGFAKFFFGAAGEEREHATKLIEYLSMRGVEDFDSIVNVTVSLINILSNFLKLLILNFLLQKLLMDEKVLDAPISTIDALKRALTLETLVTKNIRVVIEACEGKEDKDYNHYHVSSINQNYINT